MVSITSIVVSEAMQKDAKECLGIASTERRERLKKVAQKVEKLIKFSTSRITRIKGLG